MRHFFTHLYHRWKELLSERKFRLSLMVGLLVLLVAWIANYYASVYTQDVATMSVGDLILDHIPTIDLVFMYTFGIYLTEVIVIVYPIFFKPEIAPFTAKTTAAFIIIRAFFISLTHLGAPENFLMLPQFINRPAWSTFFYTNDLFFSAHTGFPFLIALLFWECKPLRFFMIAMSVAQAITVLFMHVHYSIDVFSAYFITYTIYVVSDKIFNKLNLSFKRIVESIEEKMKMRLGH